MKRKISSANNQADTLLDYLTEITSLLFRESPSESDYYNFDLIEFHQMSNKLYNTDPEVYQKFSQNLHEIRNYIQSKKHNNSNISNSKIRFRENLIDWGVLKPNSKIENNVANLSRKMSKTSVNMKKKVEKIPKVNRHNVNSLVSKMNKISVVDSDQPQKKTRKTPKSWLK